MIDPSIAARPKIRDEGLSRPSSVFAALLRSARRTPAAIAVSYKGRDWKYGELVDAALKVAWHMRTAGVLTGETVAFMARNSDLYAIGWLATQAIGAVHVPINFMLKSEEVKYLIQHSRSRILFFGEEFRSVAECATADTAIRAAALLTPEMSSNGSSKIDIGRISSSQPAQLAYTSGTESTPKGAVLTDTSLIHEYLSCIHVGEYQSTDIVINALPLYHCAQMHCFLMPQLMVGARNIILDRADAKEILATIEVYGATSFFAPPTVWIGLLGHPSFAPDRLRSLTKAYYGASIMPAQTLRSLRDALPWLRLWNYYGQTEIGPLAAALRPEEIEERPWAAGRPVLFVETRIVDDDGNDMPAGEVGELVHRSPQLMSEYFDDPSRTAEAYRDGWFRSGDLGFMDSEGYIGIVDRKKDMIKTGGENVSSREVEDVIYTHPSVAEVAVVGRPDSRWIEAVTAVVVLRPNLAASEEDIINWCARTLASYKRPKRVFFLAELPKNPSGKILKRQLRERLSERS